MVKKVVISSVKCPTGAFDILSISLLHSNMVNSLLSLRLDTFLDGVSTIDVLEVLLTIYNFSLGSGQELCHRSVRTYCQVPRAKLTN